jgi:hypothetical protein
MDIAQTMTPTLFRQWARQSVLTGSDGNLDVMASPRPVFYRAMIAKTVILIEEAWIYDTRSSEEGPC